MEHGIFVQGKLSRRDIKGASHPMFVAMSQSSPVLAGCCPFCGIAPMFTEEAAKQRAAQVLEQIREDWETTGTGTCQKGERGQRTK